MYSSDVGWYPRSRSSTTTVWNCNHDCSQFSLWSRGCWPLLLLCLRAAVRCAGGLCTAAGNC